MFNHIINTLVVKANLPVRQEGQAMVEYGLILALVAVVGAVALTGVGTELATLFTGIETSLAGSRAAELRQVASSRLPELAVRPDYVSYVVGAQPTCESIMRPGRQKAQAMVELALSMTFLLWIAFGTLDFGRVFYLYIELTNAAREGARYATLLGTDCQPAPIQALLAAREPGLFSPPHDSLISLELPCPSTDTPDRRTVTITDYPFVPVTPFIADMLGDGSVIPLTTSATLPVLSD